MAIMHPSEFMWDSYDKRSREYEMFQSLKKLPDDYHVFYSFKVLLRDGYKRVGYEKVSECEMDFLVFHPTKGLAVIEAKSGDISFRNREWYKSKHHIERQVVRTPFKMYCLNSRRPTSNE